MGSVPYINARPLVHGLAQRDDVVYCEAIPSRLAGMLERDEVDAALVSSVEALKLPGSRPVGDLCIATDGPALSVKLIGAGDPLTARVVRLDGASLTAAALTQVAYRLLLDRNDVEFLRAPPAPAPAAVAGEATLVIGDAALRPPEVELEEVDLGALWTERTGLPFVWAVWLAKPTADFAALESVLSAARGLGLREMDAHARDAPAVGVKEDVALDYLSRVMRYRMGDREQAGLRRFLELAAKLGDFL